MLTFERYEQFKQQDQRFQALRSRYDAKLIEAGRRIADLTAELQAVLTSEFAEGSDKTAEKERIRKRIAEAERERDAAEDERAKAYEFTRSEAEVGRITPRDVVIEWNGAFRDTVRATELQPIIDRMARARHEYINAVLDYEVLAEDYRLLHDDIRELSRMDGNHLGARLSANPPFYTGDLPLLTDEVLFRVRNFGEWPVGAKREVTK